MSLTRKTPVKDMEQIQDVLGTIEQKLISDRNNAYTIAGLMIECFGIKENDINKPWRDWKEGDPALYSRIKVSLDRLIAQGKVRRAKKGKAMHYWYVAATK